MDAIGRCFGDTLEKIIREQNTNLNSLCLYDHYLIKKTQAYSFGKLNSKELYNIFILGNCKKPTSQGYFEAFLALLIGKIFI